MEKLDDRLMRVGKRGNIQQFRFTIAPPETGEKGNLPTSDAVFPQVYVAAWKAVVYGVQRAARRKAFVGLIIPVT